MLPRWLRALALSWGLVTLMGGCMHVRDFRSPYERVTPMTAYAEPQRVRLDVDLLATDSQRFVANAGLTVAAVPKRLDFSLNLLHGAIGAVTAQSKFTVVDRRHYGLGGRVGLAYLNPRTFWFLPPELRRELGTFHLVTVPLELWQSVPITRWFGFDLGLRYRLGSISGAYESESLLLDASLASRGLTVIPVLDFYIAARIALRVRANLPLYTRVAEATSAEINVNEDLILGVRSVEWIAGRFRTHVQLGADLEARLGTKTYLLLGVSVWAFRPLDVLSVAPSLRVYWRF